MRRWWTIECDRKEWFLTCTLHGSEKLLWSPVTRKCEVWNGRLLRWSVLVAAGDGSVYGAGGFNYGIFDELGLWSVCGNLYLQIQEDKSIRNRAKWLWTLCRIQCGCGAKCRQRLDCGSVVMEDGWVPLWGKVSLTQALWRRWSLCRICWSSWFCLRR